MKNYKILSSLAFLFLMSTNLLIAQGPNRSRNMDPEQTAERQTANMTEQLSLSEAQTEKVGEVNLFYAKKLKEARDKANGDRSQMRETMRAMRTELSTEIKKYLTEEQFPELGKRWRRKQRQRRRRSRGDHQDGEHGKKEKKTEKS